jgi:hypothetical protein
VVRAPLRKVEVVEYDKVFETLRPVAFRYVRNTEKAPFFDAMYQQNIEPTGVYLLHNPDPGDLPPKWEQGEVTLHTPLVIPFNTAPMRTYDKGSWKAQLHRAYDARGRRLSRLLMDDGYDSVVTVSLARDGTPLDTREIVLLRA